MKPREGAGDMRLPFAVKTGLTLDLAKSTLPSTRFAFKLYREILREEGAANIFVSPASVMLCLCLLREGATGETQAAIDRVLEIASFDGNAFESAVGALKSVLQGKGPGLELEIANSVWCNQACTPRSEYLAKVKKDHDGEVIVLDFGNPETVDQMNGWVSGKTRGKINSIVESLDPLAILVAINAVYFKDLWVKPFEARLTREQLFHTGDGRGVKIPLMSQHGSYPYHEESGFQAVRLGYKNSRLAMYVFLPAKTSSLQQFQENMNSVEWDKWMERLETAPGHIRLPRFKLAFSAKLKVALDKLGMGIVFAPGEARFDTIIPPPPAIWVDEVLHRAFVEVNEEGTEAAATTDGELLGFGSEPPSFQMIVDRPFFLAIRDDHTGTMWFMGAVEDPSLDAG
jgi:serine protease inhibitor